MKHTNKLYGQYNNNYNFNGTNSIDRVNNLKDRDDNDIRVKIINSQIYNSLHSTTHHYFKKFKPTYNNNNHKGIRRKNYGSKTSNKKNLYKYPP